MLRRIKLCLGVLSFIWGAMSLVIVFVLHDQTVDARNLFNNRFLALQLADEMRQSSDDLTRFARSYAATGQSKFLAHFQNVLDIRNGVALRPDGYEFANWNLAIPKSAEGTHQDKLRSIE